MGISSSLKRDLVKSNDLLLESAKTGKCQKEQMSQTSCRVIQKKGLKIELCAGRTLDSYYN